MLTASLRKFSAGICLTAAAALPGPARAQDTGTAAQTAPAIQQLPPSPPGKATVIGGRIGSLDPIRDQFTLKVYGGSSMRILYDARTQLYRDGVRASLHSLRPEERASVETTLDGTSVFALKIHMLSQMPQGECKGQVIAPGTDFTSFTVHCDLTESQVAFRVPAGTPVFLLKQEGNSSRAALPADIVKGSLVRIDFKSGDQGQSTATKVTILARPGSSFVFRGKLVSLDLPGGRMVVADSQDDASYSISFPPGSLPGVEDIQQGAQVSVTAGFNGSGYVASAIRRN